MGTHSATIDLDRLLSLAGGGVDDAHKALAQVVGEHGKDITCHRVVSELGDLVETLS